jgi:hypothetical protein
MADTISAAFSIALRVTHTIDVDVTGVTGEVATHFTQIDADPSFDEIITGTSGTLNAGTTPAATKTWSGAFALSGGAKTHDFADLRSYSATEVDASGLEVILFKFINNGTNTMTIVDGASNGYPILGDTSGSITIAAGGSFEFYTADGIAQVVDGTHKTIDISGTGVEEYAIQIVFG